MTGLCLLVPPSVRHLVELLGALLAEEPLTSVSPRPPGIPAPPVFSAPAQLREPLMADRTNRHFQNGQQTGAVGVTSRASVSACVNESHRPGQT